MWFKSLERILERFSVMTLESEWESEMSSDVWNIAKYFFRWLCEELKELSRDYFLFSAATSVKFIIKIFFKLLFILLLNFHFFVAFFATCLLLVKGFFFILFHHSLFSIPEAFFHSFFLMLREFRVSCVSCRLWKNNFHHKFAQQQQQLSHLMKWMMKKI